MDVIVSKISYFLLQPKAKGLIYLQPGEAIILKFGEGWVKAQLEAKDRKQYQDSS